MVRFWDQYMEPTAATPRSVTLAPLWSMALPALLRGVSVVRERGYLFVWDEKNCLQLFNAQGELQARADIPDDLVAAAASDTGEVFIAVARNGQVYRLGPDLAVADRYAFRNGIQAMALDPHGSYFAFAETPPHLGVADVHGKLLWRVATPRTLLYLSFMPTFPYVVGASNFGLVACHDFRGNCTWKHGLVSNVGSMFLRGADSQILLACFSEGLQRYSYMGKDWGRTRIAEPCSLIAGPYEGELIAAAGLTPDLKLLTLKGELVARAGLEAPASLLACSAPGDQIYAYTRGVGLAAFAVMASAGPPSVVRAGR